MQAIIIIYTYFHYIIIYYKNINLGDCQIILKVIDSICKYILKSYPDNSPGGQFPTLQGLVLMSAFIPWKWSQWGVVLVSNSPRDCGPGGNGWALFLCGGELSSLGVVLEPSLNITKLCKDEKYTFMTMYMKSYSCIF